MKVRVRKFRFRSQPIEIEEPFINEPDDFEAELEEIHRRMAEKAAIDHKAYEEYFAMFPDDKPLYFQDEDEGYMDGLCHMQGGLIYLWGVENHKHWWEKEDLPDDVILNPEEWGLP